MDIVPRGSIRLMNAAALFETREELLDGLCRIARGDYGPELQLRAAELFGDRLDGSPVRVQVRAGVLTTIFATTCELTG